MTDEQIVKYFEQLNEAAFNKGYQKGMEKQPNTGDAVKKFLDTLLKDKVPGIGAVTITKLMKVAREYGFIE